MSQTVLIQCHVFYRITGKLENNMNRFNRYYKNSVTDVIEVFILQPVYFCQVISNAILDMK